jgi:Tfp pilus assembly protein PilN
MRAVNLLPDGGGKSRPPILTTTTVAIGGAVLLAVVWIVLGVSWFSAHNSVSSRNHRLAALQTQITKLEAAKAAKAAQTAGNAPSESGRVAAFDTASSARVNWDNLLDDISRVLPPGSWLSSLSMQGSPSTAATAGPSEFTVSGVALSTDVVAQVMERLALIPALSNITLVNTSRSDIGLAKAFAFSMSGAVNAPEVAQ